MIQLTKDQIRTKVRLLLDEQGVNEAEFSDFETDTSEHDDARLDEIIVEKALEALRYVHGNADVGLLEDAPTYSVSLKDATIVAPYLVGTYQLPENYLRVCHVGCASWPYRVSGEDVVRFLEPDYALLHDKYATGTCERPKVGLRQDRTLELYSLKNADDSGVVSFLSQPIWETEPDEEEPSAETTGTPNENTEATEPSEETSETSEETTESTEETTETSEETTETTEDTTGTTDEETEDDTPVEYISVCTRVADAFLYYLAGLTCMILGDERQQGFFQQAAELMGKTNNNQ